MVAFSSSRRQKLKPTLPVPSAADALAACGTVEPLRDAVTGAASRRSTSPYEVERRRGGEIASVRIGRWRVLTAGPQRRLAEVRELPNDRIAVRIDRYADGGDRPSSEIWQLYDLEGRLEAAMQSTPDGNFALLTNYQTRQASRLVRNQQNELETVECWKI
jgi:hypothetical protein